MRKVYSCRFVIYLSLFGIVFFSFPTIIFIFYLFDSIVNHKTNLIVAWLGLIIVSSCFIFLYLFMLNRLGCKIIYNEKEKTIIRKGFICGYKYIVKIEDIKEIIIASFPKETTYYVFIDSINTKYAGGFKKSFIRIEKNEKNLKFIKQFWNKPIKNN